MILLISNTEASLQLVVRVVLCAMLRLIAIDLLTIGDWQGRHNQGDDVVRERSRTIRIGVTELHHSEHTLSEYTAGGRDRIILRFGLVIHLERAQEGRDLHGYIKGGKTFLKESLQKINCRSKALKIGGHWRFRKETRHNPFSVMVVRRNLSFHP